MANNTDSREKLSHLVSTEQLDQAPRQILFRGWLLLGLSLLFIISFFLFTYFVKIPVIVKAPGILWSESGVQGITSNSTGRVLNLMVDRGSQIHKGDTLLYVDQTDLLLEKNALTSELEFIQLYISKLKELINQDGLVRSSDTELLDDLQEERLDRLSARLDRLNIRKIEYDDLLSDGLIEIENYNNLIDQMTAIEDERSSIEQAKLQRLRDDRLSGLQLQKELVMQMQQELNLNSALDKLDSQMDEKGSIIAPATGTITEVLIKPGDFIGPGQQLITLEPGVVNGLEAIVYASAAEGTKLSNGMAVEIELTAYPKEIYGKLIGHISEISQLPSSTTGMLNSLKNDKLVQQLSGDGAPFEIRVELDSSNIDRTGFKWSSRAKRERPLRNGMIFTSDIVVRRHRIINLFIVEKF